MKINKMKDEYLKKGKRDKGERKEEIFYKSER